MMTFVGPRAGLEQERYARWLAAGTRFGLAILVLSFVVYVAEIVPAHVPIERLPDLWGRSAAEFLEETGIPAGWGWAALAHRGDVMNLIGIALLATCSIPCLLAVMPIFRARREPVFIAICALEIAVLALAASGFLNAAH